MQFNIENPFVRTAVFGKQVEEFLKTDIGKYLVSRAEEEVEIAARQLKRVAPWRTTKIRALQNQILTAERFQMWLGNAVADGHQALNLLENEE